MKNILAIIFLCVSVSAFSQITVNTNFKVNSSNPIDDRFVIDNLSDTSSLAFDYAGLNVYVNAENSFFWYDGTKWDKLINPVSLFAKTDSICVVQGIKGIKDTSCVYFESNSSGGGNQNLSSVLSQGNDAGGNAITNIADPSSAQDAVSLSSLRDNYIESSITCANVRELGAVGDGVSDDTQAFLNAIATAKCVEIPTGTYLVTSKLTLQVGQRLYGAGQGRSTVNFTGTGELMQLAENTIIEGIKFVGNNSNVCFKRENAQLNRFQIYNNEVTAFDTAFSLIRTYGLNARYLGGTIRDNEIHTNNVGIYLGVRTEYMNIESNKILLNNVGVWIRGGNNKLLGNTITSNSLALKISEGENDGHGIVSNNSLNHNDSIVIENLLAGMLISDNMIYVNDYFAIQNCDKLTIIDNDFSLTDLEDRGSNTDLLIARNNFINNIDVPISFDSSLVGNHGVGARQGNARTNWRTERQGYEGFHYASNSYYDTSYVSMNHETSSIFRAEVLDSTFSDFSDKFGSIKMRFRLNEAGQAVRNHMLLGRFGRYPITGLTNNSYYIGIRSGNIRLAIQDDSGNVIMSESVSDYNDFEWHTLETSYNNTTGVVTISMDEGEETFTLDLSSNIVDFINDDDGDIFSLLPQTAGWETAGKYYDFDYLEVNGSRFNFDTPYFTDLFSSIDRQFIDFSPANYTLERQLKTNDPPSLPPDKYISSINKVGDTLRVIGENGAATTDIIISDTLTKNLAEETALLAYSEFFDSTTIEITDNEAFAKDNRYGDFVDKFGSIKLRWRSTSNRNTSKAHILFAKTPLGTIVRGTTSYHCGIAGNGRLYLRFDTDDGTFIFTPISSLTYTDTNWHTLETSYDNTTNLVTVSIDEGNDVFTANLSGETMNWGATSANTFTLSSNVIGWNSDEKGYEYDYVEVEGDRFDFDFLRSDSVAISSEKSLMSFSTTTYEEQKREKGELVTLTLPYDEFGRFVDTSEVRFANPLPIGDWEIVGIKYSVHANADTFTVKIDNYNATEATLTSAVSVADVDLSATPVDLTGDDLIRLEVSYVGTPTGLPQQLNAQITLRER